MMSYGYALSSMDVAIPDESSVQQPHTNPFLRHLPSFNTGYTTVTSSSSSILSGGRLYNKPAQPPVQVLGLSPEDSTISKFAARKAAITLLKNIISAEKSSLNSNINTTSINNNRAFVAAPSQSNEAIGDKRKFVAEDEFGLATKVTVIESKSSLSALKSINNISRGIGNSVAMANRNASLANIARSNSIINKSASASSSGFKRPMSTINPKK